MTCQAKTNNYIEHFFFRQMTSVALQPYLSTINFHGFLPGMTSLPVINLNITEKCHSQPILIGFRCSKGEVR